jgi:hypothetical protein
MLGPLADNGGPTQTRLPLSGSPLLGSVGGLVCSTAGDDQRGVSRPQGAACEAGAVEVDETPMAMMVIGKAKPRKPDRVIRNWLIGRGYDVMLIDDDDLTPATVNDLGEADLVVVTSSVVPKKVGSKLAGLAVPTLVSEGFLFDDFSMARWSGETEWKTKFVKVVDAASGHSGWTRVYNKPHRLAYGRPSAEANIVALAPSRKFRPVAFTYDTGDQLVDGTAAPGPRGAFFFDYKGPRDVRPAGIDLLDHVLDLMVDT